MHSQRNSAVYVHGSSDDVLPTSPATIDTSPSSSPSSSARSSSDSVTLPSSARNSISSSSSSTSPLSAAPSPMENKTVSQAKLPKPMAQKAAVSLLFKTLEIAYFVTKKQEQAKPSYLRLMATFAKTREYDEAKCRLLTDTILLKQQIPGKERDKICGLIGVIPKELEEKQIAGGLYKLLFSQEDFSTFVTSFVKTNYQTPLFDLYLAIRPLCELGFAALDQWERQSGATPSDKVDGPENIYVTKSTLVNSILARDVFMEQKGNKELSGAITSLTDSLTALKNNLNLSIREREVHEAIALRAELKISESKMDEHTQQIASLSTQLSESKQQEAAAQLERDEERNRNAELTSATEALRNQLEGQTNQNRAIHSQVTSLEEMVVIQATKLDQQQKDIQKQIIEITELNVRHHESLKLQIELQEKSHEVKMQKAIADLKAQQSSELDRAVAEQKQLMNAEAKEKEEKMQTTITDLRTHSTALSTQIASLTPALEKATQEKKTAEEKHSGLYNLHRELLHTNAGVRADLSTLQTQYNNSFLSEPKSIGLPAASLIGSLMVGGAGIALLLLTSTPIGWIVAIGAVAALGALASSYYLGKAVTHNSFFKAKPVPLPPSVEQTPASSPTPQLGGTPS